MNCIREGSASLSTCGGRDFHFASQRVIPCSGNRTPGFGYSPLSVEKNNLRKLPDYPEVTVRGILFDALSHRILANARIEVWHRSPKAGFLDHRAHFYTDDNGSYRFITDLPDRENGKNYNIFFKISYKRQSFFTKLSFNHSLALISSMSTATKSRNHKGSISLKRASTSFKFNIGIPIIMEELSLAREMDIKRVSV
ncbi:MAG: hypothetical protein WBM43_02480 [Flavobacteriaceae bacterium]